MNDPKDKESQVFVPGLGWVDEMPVLTEHDLMYEAEERTAIVTEGLCTCALQQLMQSGCVCNGK